MLFELFFNRTVGKFITKTIVVTEQGKKPDAKDIPFAPCADKYLLTPFLTSSVGWDGMIAFPKPESLEFPIWSSSSWKTPLKVWRASLMKNNIPNINFTHGTAT